NKQYNTLLEFIQASLSRTSFRVLNSDGFEATTGAPSDNTNARMQVTDDNVLKHKYICKVCGELCHNSRNKTKYSK
ncbi:4156_t:CDS:2, partial [Racocetra fulgida]